MTYCTQIFLDKVRMVARGCGYAIAVHGSLHPDRDLDLVAVPWTPEAVSADQLVKRLCEEVPMREQAANVYQDGRVTPNPEPKPWGRWAWSLRGCPEHKYVDLSVAPRAGDPVPLLTAESLAGFVSASDDESGTTTGKGERP